MPCVRQRWGWLHIFSRPLNLYLPAYLYIYYLCLQPLDYCEGGGRGGGIQYTPSR